MAFDISEFKSKIAAQGGLLKNNRFLVRIVPPSGIQNGNQTSQFLEFFADSANIPGISLQTFEVRRQGIGNIEKAAWGAAFTDLDLSFRVDQKSQVWKFFKNWMELIYSYNISVGTLHELEYKDNYATAISLFVYNEIEPDYPTIIIDFQDAFPIAMPDIGLNWGSSDIMRFNIRFNYRSWNIRDEVTPLTTTGSLVQTDGVQPIPSTDGNVNNNPSNINIQF